MKILMGVVILLLVLGGGYYLLTTRAPGGSGNGNATSTPIEVVVATRTINEETPTLLIDAEYPQFGLPAEASAQAGISSINAQIETIVRDSVDSFKKDTEAAPPSPVDAKYEFVSVFDPPYIGNDAISVRLIVSTYTGGAHPMAYLNGLNFERASGRLLTLSDALAMVDLQLSDVAAESLRQMRARHGEGLFADGLVATPENYGTFIVDGTKVTFVFQLYQIAAYAAGFQEVSFARKK